MNVGSNQSQKTKPVVFDSNLGIPKGSVTEKTSFSQKAFLVGTAPNRNQNEINNIFRQRLYDGTQPDTLNKDDNKALKNTAF